MSIQQSRKWLRWLFASDGALVQRAIRSGFWVFALRSFDYSLSVVRTIVLARILAPAEFGLLGYALLSLSILETLFQTGLNSALVQKQENTDAYLSTAWTVQVLRAVLLAVALIVIAPYIADFFGEPGVALLLRLLSLHVFFRGLNNIGIVYFGKDLEFRKQFLHSISATITNLVVTLLATIFFKNVLALICGLLVSSFVQVIVSYIIHPYRPQLKFEMDKAKELLKFGKWMAVTRILSFFVIEGDDIFVGKFLGATSLGLYRLAYRYASLPATEISHVISQVSFPTYAKIQTSLVKLRIGYLETLRLTALISVPLSVLIYTFASDFTRIFLGEAWMSMVGTLEVLAAWGLLRSFTATMGTLFQAIGKPKLFAGLQFSKFLVMALFIYPLTMRWGIIGTAWVVVLGAFLAEFLPGLFMLSHVLKLSLRDIVVSILPPSLGMGCSIAIVLVLKTLLGDTNLVSFFLLGGVSVLCYLVAMYVFDDLLNFGIKSWLRKRFEFLFEV